MDPGDTLGPFTSKIVNGPIVLDQIPETVSPSGFLDGQGFDLDPSDFLGSSPS